MNTKEAFKKITLIRLAVTTFRRIFGNNSDINHLFNLIINNKFAVLKPCLEMRRNESGKIVLEETLKDYFGHYKTIRVRKPGNSRLRIPPGAILIHHPLAMLNLSSDHDTYLSTVGAKTRNIIRKAEKFGYDFKEFEWNDFLDQIYEINTSKEVRSSGKMHGWYTEPVSPRFQDDEERQFRKYYGVFKNDRMVAYSHLAICGDFAFFKHFIGHGDHLKFGIMNYLLSCIVKELFFLSSVNWLNYGWMLPENPETRTVTAFKRHAGFSCLATFLDLENDHDLISLHIGMRDINLEKL